MVIVLGMSFGSHIHRKKSSSSSLSSSAKRKERTPTQQTQQPTGIRKKSEFICTTKFNNQLPDVPFDPKFLVFPFTENQFVKYRTTSLEKNYKRPIYTNPTLGMNINVIDPDVYRSSSFLSELDEVDNTLVRDYSSTQKANGGFQLKASWLRRTEYFTPQVEQTFGTSISEDKLNNATEVEELYPEERARKIEQVSLIEWFANNYFKWGCELEFITDRSQEGSQFCKGFGGIGGILRFKPDFMNNNLYNDDSEWVDDDDFEDL